MYSVLMSLHACPVTWQANFFSTGPLPIGPVATDRFPRLTFPTSQAALPSHALFQLRCSISLKTPPAVDRLALYPLQAADHRQETFSTHVKLQLLPKSIPMASCCAEEMLISLSPSVLDYVQIPPTPQHLSMKKADWAGGGHI